MSHDGRDANGRPPVNTGCDDQMLLYARDLAQAHAAERQRWRQLKDVENKLGAVLRVIADAVALVDRKGSLLEWNPQLEVLLGAGGGLRPGENLGGLLEFENFAGFLDGIVSPGHCRSVDITPRGAPERRLRMTACEASGGRLALVFRDVTEQWRAESLRQDILRRTAHAIKSPLAGILGMCEVLQDGAISAEEQSIAKTIQHSCRQVRRGVDSLLHLTALMGSRLEDGSQEVVLQKSVSWAAQEAQDAWDEKGLSLQLELCAEPLLVLGNRPLLAEMIRQMLSPTALKGDDRGAVRVVLAAEDGMASLAVAGYREGISMEEAEAAPQEPAGNPTRVFVANGLGLAIAQRIATLHGGGAGLDRDAGGSLRCRVTLPLLRHPPAAPGPGSGRTG